MDINCWNKEKTTYSFLNCSLQVLSQTKVGQVRLNYGDCTSSNLTFKSNFELFSLVKRDIFIYIYRTLARMHIIYLILPYIKNFKEITASE